MAGAMAGSSNDNSGSGAPLVFITGASGGLGQALALRYWRAGWRLALVARRTDAVKAWACAAAIPADSHQIYGADVTDPESIGAAARLCLQRQGLPDVVIANAGISIGMDTAQRADLEVLARTLATNIFGVAATFQPFVAAMCARASGTLVAIASVAAIRGLPGHGAYCASKAGLLAYSESLRGELRAHGLRVVTIVPGYVDTPLTRKNRYAMPFLIDGAAFAESAWRAISAGASYRVIPWQMALVAKLLRLLPNALFDRLMAGRPRKQRQSGAAPPPAP